MKPLKKSKKYRDIGVLTLVSLLLIIWEMSIYRRTFIHVWIPVTVLVAGGFLFFILVRNKIRYYRESKHAVLAQALHGTFTFGGILMFFFMALNYYVPINHKENTSLKILKTDHFGGHRGRIGDPYAIVMYHGVRKQLVFSRRANLENCTSVHLEINRGLFGFMTIEKMRLEKNEKDDWEIEVAYQYDKIKLKAEEYYSEGNLEKAIELYERAVQLRPGDKQAAFRLKELKSF